MLNLNQANYIQFPHDEQTLDLEQTYKVVGAGNDWNIVTALVSQRKFTIYIQMNVTHSNMEWVCF